MDVFQGKANGFYYFFGFAKCSFIDAFIVYCIHAANPPYRAIRGDGLGEFTKLFDFIFEFGFFAFEFGKKLLLFGISHGFLFVISKFRQT